MSNAVVVSVINWKGGVGKTTLAHHLACGLQKLKLSEIEALAGLSTYPRVLLVDTDAQCNLSVSCLEAENYEKHVYTIRDMKTLVDVFYPFLNSESPNVDVASHILKRSVRAGTRKVYAQVDLLPAHQDLIYADMNVAIYRRADFRGSLLNPDMYKFTVLDRIIDRVRDQYDFIIIDCPPNLNYVTQNALYASSHYLIPSIPDRLSTYGILAITSKVKELDDSFSAVDAGYSQTSLLGIVINNVREYAQAPKASQANTIDRLKDAFGKNSVFASYLTYGDGIPRASELGFPVFALEGSNPNASKQSDAIRDITREFIRRVRGEIPCR